MKRGSTWARSPIFNPSSCAVGNGSSKAWPTRRSLRGKTTKRTKILKRWAAEFPNNGRPYLMLAAIDALHGRDAAAAANMAKHRQMLPLSSVSYVVLTYPSTDPTFLAQRARLVDGLRKAHLPEGDR